MGITALTEAIEPTAPIARTASITTTAAAAATENIALIATIESVVLSQL